MKAAELTQIIEEGNLHASSTKGSYKFGPPGENNLQTTQKSNLSYIAQSHNKSLHDQSDFVQQHDITSSFLRQEERYNGATRNQALEREHIRDETLEY